MKKFLCLALALMLIVSCFAACGGSGDDDKSTDTSSVSSGSDASTGDTSTSEGENEDYISMFKNIDVSAAYGLDGYDLNKREFYIMQRWFGYGKPTIDFQGEVIWNEPENGQLNSINTAKKRVLDEVQALLNCTVTGEISSLTAGDIRDLVSTDVLTELGEFDFCFESPYYYTTWVQDKMLVDLKDLGIQFDQPWWDQNAVKDLSIMDSLYFALGDINTYDNDGTFVLLINKTLYNNIKDKDYTELFKMAKDRTWTFDALKEEVKGVYSDIGGEPGVDEFDQFGLLTETANLYTHALAAGEKIATKDAEDVPQLSLQTTRTYESLIGAVELYQTQDVLVANTEPYLTKYPEGDEVYEKTVTNTFEQGRGLFYLSGLIHLPYFRNMDDEIGVLPVPMFDEAQGEYTHQMSVHTASAVFVPVGPNSEGENGKQIGLLLDALGAYSKQYLTPEYYNKQLQQRDFQDPDSAAMLDIIFETRAFDLGAFFGSSWNNAFDLYCVMDTNVESRFSAQVDMIQAKMEITLDAIRAKLPVLEAPGA